MRPSRRLRRFAAVSLLLIGAIGQTACSNPTPGRY